jgi:hypothetical protein
MSLFSQLAHVVVVEGFSLSPASEAFTGPACIPQPLHLVYFPLGSDG